MKRSYEEILPDLEHDGALRDFCINDTIDSDWDKLITWVRPMLEPDCFFVDGKVKPFPRSFAEIAKVHESATPLLSIPVAGAYVNCHFFDVSEIELDFRPDDYRRRESWNQICQFFQSLVDLVGKRGIATHENSPAEIIEEFEPIKKVERDA